MKKERDFKVGHWRLDLETWQVSWDENLKANYGFGPDHIPDIDFLQQNYNHKSQLLAEKVFRDLMSKGHAFEEVFELAHNDFGFSKVRQTGIIIESKDGKPIIIGGTSKPVFDTSLSVDKFEQIIANDRLKIIGEYTAQMIHDVMTPVTIIKSRMKALSQAIKTGDTPKIKDNFFDMATALQRLININKGMRRLLVNERQTDLIELNKTVEDTILFVLKKIKDNGIGFKFFRFGEELLCDASEFYIGQILINLINNSIDAIKDSEKPWIRIFVMKDNEYYYIKVCDSGEGIPEEIASKIFDTLFTTKANSNGTGLGLSLCKTLAKEINSELIYNDKALNTEFILKIPQRQ